MKNINVLLNLLKSKRKIFKKLNNTNSKIYSNTNEEQGENMDSHQPHFNCTYYGGPYESDFYHSKFEDEVDDNFSQNTD